MPRRFAAAVALASTTALIVACGENKEAGAPPEPAMVQSPETHRAEVQAWRDKHEVDYRAAYSTISGLHTLKPGVNSAGSAANHRVVLAPSTPETLGRFVLEGTTVRFEPARSGLAEIKGQPVTGPVVLKDDRAGDPDELVVGDVRIVVHPSGDLVGLRVRDPNSAQAKGFLGFRWFDFDPSFRVVGRFIADPEPRKLRVVNTYGELDEHTTEGVVEFTWQGQTLRLRPFTTRPRRLYFVFRDASAGQETYEAARFLYADLADDGSVVLDFNISYNPPCAFNSFTTCPIPLPENRLPVKILAGERAYPVKVPFGSK
jgi:uncharacterized protein (DUF1684 family)